MIKNVLNGDGLVLGFYGILWLKLKEHKEQALTTFTLPHTIIFSNCVPTQWFYSNSQGLIMRKKQTSITKESIIKTLVKTQNDICAYFITQQDEKQNVLEYIKGVDLGNFLDEPHHKNGILQQFIKPVGQYNFTIQIIWASHLILFNKRTNINKITNDKVPVHQRLATFDGNQALSTESTVITQALSLLLQKTALQIALHIETVSYGQHITQGMVIYVKIDENQRIIFLYCTSARTNFFQKDTKKNHPITLHQNLIHDPSKYKSQPCYYTKSKAIKQLDCVSCSQRQDPQDMFNCKLSVLIDHHERQQVQPPVDDEEKPKKILMRKQKQNIPPVVSKMLPRISMKEFQNNIEHIRNIKIYICGECYLKFRVQEREDYKFTSFSTHYKINEPKYSNTVMKGLAIYRHQSQDEIKQPDETDNGSIYSDVGILNSHFNAFPPRRPMSSYNIKIPRASSSSFFLSEITSVKTNNTAAYKLKDNLKSIPYLDCEIDQKLQQTIMKSPETSKQRQPRHNIKFSSKF